jgi:MtN3 and saliva related transmembrane protein
MWTEIIGWSAAAILLATISRQVYTQWRERSTQGLSRWLFIGQLAASSGFVVYSWLLGNWVFVVTNVLMLATAGLGQWIYLRNRHREEKAERTRPKSGARRRAAGNG